MDLAILGGTVVTPSAAFQANVYINDGKIAALSSERLPAAKTVDAAGLYVLPGVVDSHVHFMDPGAPEREDFITGSAAAAVGGATTVIEHTHVSPVTDAATFRHKVEYLRNRSLVDFGLGAHVFPDRIDEIHRLWEAGALFLKVFTCTTHGIAGILPGDLLRLLQRVASIDAICLVHCEDEFITADAERRLKAAGRKDFGVIPLWRSREAELVAVNTVGLLARLTGARVVIAHASQVPVIDLAVRERQLGTRVWVESCPQYFYLREEEVLDLGPYRKFTPPARCRSEAEMRSMWRRLQDGAITYIATDHAPSTRAQKDEGDIWEVHFGLPGVETTLTMLLNGMNEGWLTLQRLVEVSAEAPARIYGLYPRKGSLQVGADADMVVVDLSRERVLRDDDVISRAAWTPYAGRRVRGRPLMTFVRGRLVAEEGRPVGEPGWGTFVSRTEIGA